jgi:hypothetical protein
MYVCVCVCEGVRFRFIDHQKTQERIIKVLTNDRIAIFIMRSRSSPIYVDMLLM